MKRELYSERMGRLGTESAFTVLAKAKALEAKGIELIHFEIGEPDFDTPKHIIDAAVEAARNQWTHYTPSAGIAELREAIADTVSESRRIDIDPNREVVVLPGAKPAIFNSLMAIVDSGDEVIVPNPGFPIYESVVRFAGGEPVFAKLKEEDDFNMKADDIAKLVTEKTKVIIINSPENPCGSVLQKSDVEALAELAIENDIFVISDEVYCKIFYEGDECLSIASEPGMKERTLIIDGFSKTYAMTGWRLGYAVGPAQLIEYITQLQTNSTSCVNAFVQKGGVAALRGPQDCVTEMVAKYRERRDTIVQGLNEIDGISCRMPRGAFYVMANIRDLGKPSNELMEHLMKEARVVTLPGPAMGSYAEGYLRFSYATSIENIKEGIKRIETTVSKLQ
ncbi:MAG: pyridoxal phosphate-dependent aminotransferase [Candidatus Bathyarchaeota archaeon]|nr:MAG: pyridoxal phosphate-dependent aminotransferase [Candidatus Bathyarchaeota archaeon]